MDQTVLEISVTPSVEIASSKSEFDEWFSYSIEFMD
jgi:hypothetical protein